MYSYSITIILCIVLVYIWSVIYSLYSKTSSTSAKFTLINTYLINAYNMTLEDKKYIQTQITTGLSNTSYSKKFLINLFSYYNLSLNIINSRFMPVLIQMMILDENYLINQILMASTVKYIGLLSFFSFYMYRAKNNMTFLIGDIYQIPSKLVILNYINNENVHSELYIFQPGDILTINSDQFPKLNGTYMALDQNSEVGNYTTQNLTLFKASSLISTNPFNMYGFVKYPTNISAGTTNKKIPNDNGIVLMQTTFATQFYNITKISIDTIMNGFSRKGLVSFVPCSYADNSYCNLLLGIILVIFIALYENIRR